MPSITPAPEKVEPTTATAPTVLAVDQPIFDGQQVSAEKSEKIDTEDTTSNTRNPALSQSTKRLVLLWASDTMIRAQTIMYGSDDVPLLLDAAMEHSQTYRDQLSKIFDKEGVEEPKRDQILAMVEERIRTTTRDFILKAKTLLKRQPESPSKSDDQLYI
jgi:hypothetical protein